MAQITDRLLESEEGYLDQGSIDIDTTIKDDFIIKLYYYYIHKGYYNIITTQLVNLLTSIFLFVFLLFIFNCLNYESLFTLEEKDDIQNYINWSNIINFDFIGWICFVTFVFLTICKLISIISDINSYYKIKKFYYKKLKITDSQLASLNWINVIEKLTEYLQCPLIDVYVISSKVNARDNYLISLFDNDLLNINYLSKLLEWNIKFCIINSIFTNNNKIDKKILIEENNLTNKVKTKIKWISIVNFIFMPLIILFIFFNTLFKYGEIFYTKPESIGMRNWSLLAQWKLRHYNETYHVFQERLKKGKNVANLYVNQFPSKIIETFSRLIVFISSSVFLLLLFLTVVNESLLINLNISPGRPILWYMGILGTVIALSKTFIQDNFIFYPQEKMNELKDIMCYIPLDWIQNAKDIKTKKKFTKLYEYQVISIFKEFYYTLVSPFTLWDLTNNIDDIINYIIVNTEYETNIGYKIKDAIFNKRIAYAEDNDNKPVKSFVNFQNKYPDWADKYFNEKNIIFNIRNEF